MPDLFFSSIMNHDGSVYYVKDANARTELANKVDKVTGYGLSQNDFTNALLSKLNGIESGAEVNIIESVSVDNVPLTVVNKNVNISTTGFVTPSQLSAVMAEIPVISYDETDEQIVVTKGIS